MKLTADFKTFAQAMTEIAPFSPARPTIPVLKYARITAKGDMITIEASDIQNAAMKHIPVLECDEAGQFLIEIGDMKRFLSKAKGDTIEITADGARVTIKHANGEVSFAAIAPEEYPSFKHDDEKSCTLEIPAKALCSFIKLGKGFCSTEQLFPPMTAIYAYVKNGVFGFCATDTHRLVADRTEVMFDPAIYAHWYIVPAIFAPLLKACSPMDGDITVEVSEGHVSYKMRDTIIRTTQIKGKYPDFERVIPKTWNLECSCDRGELLESVNRSSIFCDGSRCIRLDVSCMDMVMSVDNLNDMKKSTESVTHNGCNGEMTFGMSADNLQQCLSACSPGDVLIRMSDASHPVLFNQENTPNRTILAMPMCLPGQ